MKNLFILVFLCAASSILFAGDYESAIEAIKKQEHKTAIALLEKASSEGDTRADIAMSQIYFIGNADIKRDDDKAIAILEKLSKNGNTEAKITLAKFYLGFFDKNAKIDAQKARVLARECAKVGNTEGMYLIYYAKALDPELNFLENGKANTEKYTKLSNRTMKERSLDIEAYDMLARSARLKYQPAAKMMAILYYESIGNGNNDKVLKIISKANQPLFVNMRKQLEVLKKLGETRATYKIVSDAQTTAILTATIKAYGLNYPEDCKTSKFLSIKSVGDIENPVYLPLTEPDMQKSILISGKWVEKWTYDICGKEAEVLMTFTTDGLGGAYFKTDFPALKK
jgi:TPR repeat protein